jgi:hypothetical protein
MIYIFALLFVIVLFQLGALTIDAHLGFSILANR